LRTSGTFQTELLLISGRQDSLSSPVGTCSSRITHSNIIAYEKGTKRLQPTRSHSCKWSSGNTPFSGGTGLAPLFPPNAPPVSESHRVIQRLVIAPSCSLGRGQRTDEHRIGTQSSRSLQQMLMVRKVNMNLQGRRSIRRQTHKSSPALISQVRQDSDLGSGGGS
jgi:hypothetical protein